MYDFEIDTIGLSTRKLRGSTGGCHYFFFCQTHRTWADLCSYVVLTKILQQCSLKVTLFYCHESRMSHLRPAQLCSDQADVLLPTRHLHSALWWANCLTSTFITQLKGVSSGSFFPLFYCFYWPSETYICETGWYISPAIYIDLALVTFCSYT